MLTEAMKRAIMAALKDAKQKLCSQERNAVSNGLNIAAEQYDKDAEHARMLARSLRSGQLPDREAQAKGHDRIAEQFERQAKEAREIIEKVEP